VNGSIKQRSAGSWTLRFDLGRGPDGRRKQKVVTLRGTKKHAEMELRRLMHELETGKYADPGRLTVAQYLERWLEHMKTQVSAKTWERYAEIVRCHLSPALGHQQLSKLQPLAIQEYYAHASKSGRRDGSGGLSPQTVVHHHRLLHAALKQAVRWQLLARNPAEAADPPSVPDRDIEVLDEGGVLRLLELALGNRLYIPCVFASTAAMRLGEILALGWDAVDLDGGLLWVRRTLEETRSGLAFKPPKTHRSKRPISLPPFTVEALRRHKGEQAQLQLLLGTGYRDQGLVVAREDGSPWAVRTMSKAFEHLAARAGVPGVRFHDLRHTHATILLTRQKEDIKVVQERLGHARASTTLDIYGHVLPGMQDAAARRFDATLRAAMNPREEPDQETG
jgi:integrase